MLAKDAITELGCRSVGRLHKSFSRSITPQVLVVHHTAREWAARPAWVPGKGRGLSEVFEQTFTQMNIAPINNPFSSNRRCCWLLRSLGKCNPLMSTLWLSLHCPLPNRGMSFLFISGFCYQPATLFWTCMMMVLSQRSTGRLVINCPTKLDCNSIEFGCFVKHDLGSASEKGRGIANTTTSQWREARCSMKYDVLNSTKVPSWAETNAHITWLVYVEIIGR